MSAAGALTSLWSKRRHEDGRQRRCGALFDWRLPLDTPCTSAKQNGCLML